MARPSRIEFAGAWYHITSRGDRREAIYEDDEDRAAFLGVPAEVVERHVVLDGVGKGRWEGLNQQMYLGNQGFVERMQAKAQVQGDVLTVPKAQRRPPAPALSDIAASHPARNTAIMAAYATGACSYREIAEQFGVSCKMVSRAVSGNETRIPAEINVTCEIQTIQ